MKNGIRLLPRDRWVEAVKSGENDVGLVKFSTAPIVKGQLDALTGMNDINVVISSEDIDRDKDIIYQDGWDLSAYKENPVVLWAHNHGSPPIGRALNVALDGKKRLIALDRFTPKDVNEFGHMIYRMVSAGFINAASVGFRVLKYEVDEERRGFNLLETELYEHSFVPVPANPQALVEASAAGIDLRPLREWATQILDNDPDNSKILLWLPRHIVENAWKQAGYVSGNRTVVPAADTSDGVSHSSEFGTDSGHASHSRTTEQYDITTWIDAGHGQKELVDNGDDEQEEEDIMELKELTESVNKLVSAVSDLVKSNGEMSDLLKAKLDEDQVTEEEVREIARKAIGDSMAALSGKLPE